MWWPVVSPAWSASTYAYGSRTQSACGIEPRPVTRNDNPDPSSRISLRIHHIGEHSGPRWCQPCFWPWAERQGPLPDGTKTLSDAKMLPAFHRHDHGAFPWLTDEEGRPDHCPPTRRQTRQFSSPSVQVESCRRVDRLVNCELKSSHQNEFRQTNFVLRFQLLLSEKS